MKKAAICRKLAKAGIALTILLYFMLKTTSPRFLFVPFLLCCAASIGKNLGLLFNRARLTLFFDKAFKITFFLSWFGFLIAACGFAIKGEIYKVLLLTLPLWLGGLFFLTRKLRRKAR